jgi:processive 1,2-diacylglycerol beta-glucosyltransferase
VLFLSASVGEGHTSAAQAVSAAVVERQPQMHCQVVDSYRYASQVFHRVASNGYIGMVKMLPALYAYLYDQAERATKVSGFKTWLHHYTAVNLRPVITELAPDVVVCTHAFPCGVMAEFKRCYADAPPAVGVVTDFVVHPFWIHRNIDAYAVATSEMRHALIARGVPSERISVTGIPVDARFGLPASRRSLRRSLNLDTERTSVLVMGGGVGIGPLEKAMVAIDRLAHDVQTVVVVGKNASLERRLREAARMLRRPARIVGFVANVFDYMRAADILVSKPGGMTSSEALTARLPLIMLQPLPGQEERNTRYLEDRGVGIRVQTSKELAETLARLLGDPVALDRMRHAANKLAKPDAAAAVAGVIESLTTRAGQRI